MRFRADQLTAFFRPVLGAALFAAMATTMVSMDVQALENAVEPASPQEAGGQTRASKLEYNQSPGTVIGTTWHDEQQVGSMGRMIGWGTDGTPGNFLVHFSWTGMAGPAPADRRYYYKNWDAVEGMFRCETPIQPFGQYAGYVGLDLTDDNRAVVGGHNSLSPPAGPYQSHFYWDYGSGDCFFPFSSRVPDSLGTYGNVTPSSGSGGGIWPKFRYVEGTYPVLHVVAVEGDTSDTGGDQPKALLYFRRVGTDTSGFWDWPPYVIDTVYNVTPDIDAGADGKVAIGWIANRPCPGDPCDTCSGFECHQYPQADNDLYYQISYDYGMHWEPRVNITQNVDSVDGYRPYTDMSVLLTSDGNMHISWGARVWPADANYGGDAGLLSGRIFHWSENVPFIRTVHSFEWDQTTCDGGAWQLNASKMTLSECDGWLYCLFVQFNDIPNGIEDDCAANGMANGELFLSISDNAGLTWDQARNLTNSYSPGCDPEGPMGSCESDHWPSMARHGTDFVGDFSGTEIVVPWGSTDPLDYYLDVQYINDHSAGSIAQNEGSWALAKVRWFRLPCVDPVPNSVLHLSPDQFTGVVIPHGVQLDTPLVIENLGNIPLNYIVTTEEYTGPPGWLGTIGFSGMVPDGVANVDTGTVILNVGGVVYDPGTIVILIGRIIFESNGYPEVDTVEINVQVGEDLPPDQDCFESTGQTKVTLDVNDQNCDLGALIDLTSAFSEATAVELDPPPYSDGDTIHTEIISLELTGNDTILGDIVVRQRSDRQSLGTITNVVTDGDGNFVLGESFFDVFLEVEILATGDTVNTGDIPLTLEAGIIFELPPYGIDYLPPPTQPPLELYLIGTSTQVGWLCHGAHRPTIPRDCGDSPPPPDSGACCLPSLECVMVTEAQCAWYDGDWQGAGTDCATEECPPPDHDCFESIGQTIVTLDPSDEVCQYGAVIDLTSAFSEATVVELDSPPYQDGDTIETEIIALELTGSDSILGDITVRLRSDRPSPGKIVNVVTDGSGGFVSGESFFDVYVEVEIAATGAIANTGNTPIRLDAGIIFELPPVGIDYLRPPTDPPLRLYLAGSYEHIGWLCHGAHRPTILLPDCTPGPRPIGACCLNGTCLDVTDAQCNWLGGEFQGSNTSCVPDPCDCCDTDGIRGNVNYEGGIDVSDLTYLVDYLFRGGPPPPCPEEGDVDGSGGIDVADLTYLVDYLFRGGPPPAACP